MDETRERPGGEVAHSRRSLEEAANRKVFERARATMPSINGSETGGGGPKRFAPISTIPSCILQPFDTAIHASP